MYQGDSYLTSDKVVTSVPTQESSLTVQLQCEEYSSYMELSFVNVYVLRMRDEGGATPVPQGFGAFGEIIPTKLQLFEYKPITFDCEGFEVKTGWTVMRKTNGKVSKCVSTWETKRQSICAISPTYQADSGEYWCETAAGEKSNTVNITVTDGAVILESPVRPVVEGDSVPLRCRSKLTSSAHIADFYKDGVLIGSGSLGEISIKDVSKSHEGFYMCSISDYRESPQSWLAVRAAPRETHPSPDHSCHLYLVLRAVLTVIMVALLLLLVGLLQCGKIRVTPKYVCDVCKGSCQTEKSTEMNEKQQ
ncbi:low affinity immunoglobulin gamma Fc region receptor II-like [Cheilinus undulatus]|uniref:low affinity immunoglobulin gamma Fc region receptor II-like n=1 Tax=Cheilinus undulatus TaxID=241271 RepID=UPI001BD56CD7|nr:low affinity immunoglobulin gamma Fc region receptor II-like [Cheilinus undulatus]